MPKGTSEISDFDIGIRSGLGYIRNQSWSKERDIFKDFNVSTPAAVYLRSEGERGGDALAIAALLSAQRKVTRFKAEI